MKQGTILGLTFATASIISGTAYGVLYGFGPAEAWTQAQIISLTTSATTSITTFGSTFATNLQSKFEQIISAVSVATKQEALSSNQISDASIRTAQSLVSAISAQKDNEFVATAVLDYGPSTGQGFDPCGVQAKNTTLDLAFSNLSAAAYTRISATDVAPGQHVDSTAQAMQQRLQTHRDQFCTQAEADQNLCVLSDLPGGDTNAALLFEPAPENSPAAQARTAYIQHVLGEPDQRLFPEAGATPAGQAYLLQKNRKDALLSIPAHSLAMIDAANTQSADFGNRSANEIMKLRVNQYFGGAEAQQWASVLTAQTQRGLLVEAAKMAGLETWIHSRQYEQNQRMEANLAALLLTSADQLSDPLDAAYKKVLRENTARNVR